uniref:ZnMc domain-containing protein n=1 Tax=Steinernema glaseri TaxID=37863 RepID=A0A1I8AU38_9BILA
MRVVVLCLLLLVGAPSAGAFDLFGLFGSKKKASQPERTPVSDEKAKQYLQNFGYVQSSNSLSASPGGMSADFSDVTQILKSAVRKFQEFAGLKQTGELDLQTKKKMAEPRCGVTDVAAITSGRGAAFKWPKSQITYSIFIYSPDLPRNDIKTAIRRAYNVWAAVAPLDFVELRDNDESADIKIKFAAGSHGDPWPFDGRGGVLAHATMPTSGMLHFDEDENWVYMDPEKIAKHDYTDVYAVAIHEGGHTLGLSHSRDENSIMAPFYQETVDEDGNYKEPKLKADDIRAIQDIYGPRRGGPPTSDFDDSPRARPATTERPRATTTDSFWGGFGFGGRDRDRDRATTTSGRGGFFSGFFGEGSSRRGSSDESSTRPSAGGRFADIDVNCPSSLDAYTVAGNGRGYLFRGSKVYEVDGRRIGSPKAVQDVFPNGPIYAQAAVTNPRSQLTLLFQDRRVYGFAWNPRLNRFQLDAEYPKTLPSEIVFNPVGGLVWIDGQQMLLSYGKNFAVYDEYWNQQTLANRLDNYYPGFPSDIKGGVADRQGVVTLFAIDKVYKYDANSKRLQGASVPLNSYLTC